jgi:peptidoglycan/xylan/chitin deacetylase (PgdA/CDA1 family)
MRLLFVSGYLFLSLAIFAQSTPINFTMIKGAVVRGDSTRKELSLVFTADEYGEGLPAISQTLKKKKVTGSFFFTGRFYRNQQFKKYTQQLIIDGHYLGLHSDQHLLYNDWQKRDSLLVTKDSFEKDILQNFDAMKTAGITILSPHFFIPPFEWWNDSIATWSKSKNLVLFSFTPGIRTNADYTWPQLGTAYKSSQWIMNWMKTLLQLAPQKLNGAILLIHAGTDPRRKDKLYDRLDELITLLKKEGYQFLRIGNLLH